MSIGMLLICCICAFGLGVQGWDSPNKIIQRIGVTLSACGAAGIIMITLALWIGIIRQ